MNFVEKLPEEICDIIFGFFGGNDLLEFSLVSQGWNKFIGSSLVCMKKLVLALRGDWNEFTGDDKKMLLNGRKYQNVIISDGTEHVNFIVDIMREHRNWKFVKICDFLAETNDDIINLFKTFEGTVENLEMDSLKVKDPRPFETCLRFKELKSLRISFCDRKISFGVFSCSALEILDLRVSIYDSESAVPEFEPYNIENFHQMRQLTSLHIHADFFQYIKQSETDSFPFHLEDLRIFPLKNYPQHDVEIRDTMRYFLKAHSSSLKNLSFDDWFGIEVIKTAFEMKRLKKLSLGPIIKTYWNANIETFCTNNSIESLDIPLLCTHQKLTEKIFKAVPSLEKLRIYELHEPIARTIAKNLKKLKTIVLVCTPQHINLTKKILPNITLLHNFCEH